MSITLPSVRRDGRRVRRSSAKMLLAPFSARLNTTRLPSGEKRGAKVMPGKSPIASCWPLSMLNRYTRGAPLA